VARVCGVVLASAAVSAMLCWRSHTLRHSASCLSLFSLPSLTLSPTSVKKNALSRFNPFLTVSDKKVNRTKQKGKHGRTNKEQGKKRKHATSFNALDCLRHAGKERASACGRKELLLLFRKGLSLFYFVCVCCCVGVRRCFFFFSLLCSTKGIGVGRRTK